MQVTRLSLLFASIALIFLVAPLRGDDEAPRIPDLPEVMCRGQNAKSPSAEEWTWLCKQTAPLMCDTECGQYLIDTSEGLAKTCLCTFMEQAQPCCRL